MPTKKTKNTKSKKSSPRTTVKSPYATSFNNNIKKGTPFSVVINSIAKRTGKSPSVICNSLVKAGLCHRQKFNGQWIYWPCDSYRTNQTNAKICQNNMWQWFVDWCICNKICTPDQLANNSGTQKAFMDWCRKYFNRQFVSTTARKSGTRKSSARKRTSTTARSRTTKARGRKRSSSVPRTYKFPSTGSRSRRVRRAA